MPEVSSYSPERSPNEPKQKVVVRWGSLVYRSQTNFKKDSKEGYFRRGTTLQVLEKKGSWLKVQHPKNENENVWIWAGFIKHEAQKKIGRSVETVLDQSKGARDALADSIEETESLAEADPNFILTKDEERRLEGYSKERVNFKRPENISRTYEGRHQDQEQFLSDLMEGKKLSALNKAAFPNGVNDAIFVDIGPGLATQRLNEKKELEKPGITQREIAERFPNIPTVGIELPDQVNLFMGKQEGYKVNEEGKKEFIEHPNVHVISGDGLKPLPEQWNSNENNPFPDKQRPQITSNTTLIFRSANAIDVYADWKKDSKPALAKIAEDYKANPAIFLFNREIMLKPAGSSKWEIVGQVSQRGFQHFTAENRKIKGAPYSLKKKTALVEAKK